MNCAHCNMPTDLVTKNNLKLCNICYGEYRYNLHINRLCSHCSKYADILITDQIKLCRHCYIKSDGEKK